MRDIPVPLIFIPFCFYNNSLTPAEVNFKEMKYISNYYLVWADVCLLEGIIAINDLIALLTSDLSFISSVFPQDALIILHPHRCPIFCFNCFSFFAGGR